MGLQEGREQKAEGEGGEEGNVQGFPRWYCCEDSCSYRSTMQNLVASCEREERKGSAKEGEGGE